MPLASPVYWGSWKDTCTWLCAPRLYTSSGLVSLWSDQGSKLGQVVPLCQGEASPGQPCMGGRAGPCRTHLRTAHRDPKSMRSA